MGTSPALGMKVEGQPRAEQVMATPEARSLGGGGGLELRRAIGERPAYTHPGEEPLLSLHGGRKPLKLPV